MNILVRTCLSTYHHHHHHLLKNNTSLLRTINTTVVDVVKKSSTATITTSSATTKLVTNNININEVQEEEDVAVIACKRAKELSYLASSMSIIKPSTKNKTTTTPSSWSTTTSTTPPNMTAINPKTTIVTSKIPATVIATETNRKEAIITTATSSSLPKQQLQQKDRSMAMTTTEIEQAMESAEELLNLTRHGNFVYFLWKGNKENTRKVQSIHYAFLSVTSWLLQVIRTSNISEENKQTLLNQALQLTLRAEQLKIPLSLPLYSKLSSSCATYYSINKSSSSSIIRLSLSLKRTLLYSSLSPTNDIWSTFFQDTFISLIQAKKYTCAVELFHIIKRMHGYSIGYTQASNLLMLLEDQPEESTQDNNNNSNVMNVLKQFLQIPIHKMDIEEQQNMEDVARQMQDMFISFHGDDDDDANEDDEQGVNDSSSSSDIVVLSSNVLSQDQQQKPSVSSYMTSFDQTDRHNWNIKDVTPQLWEDEGDNENNESSEIYLTEEYEMYIDKYFLHHEGEDEDYDDDVDRLVDDIVEEDE